MPILKEAGESVVPAFIPPNRVNASLKLDFQLDRLTGSTVLAGSTQEPPLKVVRAFTLDDGGALAHLHNVSGGLLGSDRIGMEVGIGENATVQLTTTGATRIYRASSTSGPATVDTVITVARNACLEYLPDPIIPFAHSRFSQSTSIRLADGAGLFWWEILAPGREAQDELFAYDFVGMKTDLFALDRPIALERIHIEPGRYALTSRARLGHYRYWATFYICRVGQDGKEWSALEEQLREALREAASASDTLWGISTLVAHGVVCRCLAIRGREAMAGLHVLWRTAKLALYGSEAIPPRKVN